MLHFLGDSTQWLTACTYEAAVEHSGSMQPAESSSRVPCKHLFLHLEAGMVSLQLAATASLSVPVYPWLQPAAQDAGLVCSNCILAWLLLLRRLVGGFT